MNDARMASWLPAGAARRTRTAKLTNKCSASASPVGETLLQEITNGNIVNVNLTRLDRNRRHLPQGIASMYKRILQVRLADGVTDNSWSTAHFLDEWQNVNATVAQNANTNEAALIM